MSLGHSLKSPSLEPVGHQLPWQYRARPTLFVTVNAIVTVLALVGGLLLARRLLGAFGTDLPADLMLFLALAATTTLTLARFAWRRSFPLETPEDLSAADRIVGWGSSTALVLLAVGSCYPANRTIDWLIWLPILVADQLWRQNFFDAGDPWSPESESWGDLRTTPTPATTELPQFENIVQQLYRLEDDQGCEIIYGTVRADFVAGQRTSVVHVGFCPPLTYLPEIEAEALPGTQAKIKMVQAMAHGTRLDVRLPAPAQADCQLWIDMAARPVGTIAEAKSA